VERIEATDPTEHVAHDQHRPPVTDHCGDGPDPEPVIS